MAHDHAPLRLHIQRVRLPSEPRLDVGCLRRREDDERLAEVELEVRVGEGRVGRVGGDVGREESRRGRCDGGVDGEEDEGLWCDAVRFQMGSAIKRKSRGWGEEVAERGP